MLETLRERLLSVQQDFTSGWVAPIVPGGVAGPQPGRGEGEAGDREGGRGGDRRLWRWVRGGRGCAFGRVGKA